jgi:disulfide bond formation protein DsbB
VLRRTPVDGAPEHRLLDERAVAGVSAQSTAPAEAAMRTAVAASAGPRRLPAGRRLPGAGSEIAMQALMRSHPSVAAAALVAAGGAATILGAYFFQYVLGLPPCPLCLEQRIAYYVSIPLAVVLGFAAAKHAPRPLLAAGFAVIALAMLYNAGLGLFHAGVEWKWWPGPAECSGPIGDLGAGGDLLNQLQSISLVRCDEAAWRFLGLSLAGYNVLISLALAAIAAWGAVRVWRGK